MRGHQKLIVKLIFRVKKRENKIEFPDIAGGSKGMSHSLSTTSIFEREVERSNPGNGEDLSTTSRGKEMRKYARLEERVLDEKISKLMRLRGSKPDTKK